MYTYAGIGSGKSSGLSRGIWFISKAITPHWSSIGNPASFLETALALGSLWRRHVEVRSPLLTASHSLAHCGSGIGTLK